MVRCLSLIACLYAFASGDGGPEVVVTTDTIPPGCELELDVDNVTSATRAIVGCNRKKTMTMEAEIVRCENESDRWHLMEDVSVFEKYIKKNDKFSPGIYLNLSNIEHCNVTHLIESCTNPKKIGESSCKPGQESCDLLVPKTGVKQPVFEMKCPEDRVGEAVADVTQSVYLWDPAPLPKGVVLKFYVASTDAEDEEEEECAVAEIKKPECSTPSTWETLREKCAIVKNDDLLEKPTCGYKLVAVFEAPATPSCLGVITQSDRNYYPLIWDEEDTKMVTLLEHFTVESLSLSSNIYTEDCTEARWLEALEHADFVLDETCAYALSTPDVFKAPLKKTGGAIQADFSSLHIPFGRGGLFTLAHAEKKCGKDMPEHDSPLFRISMKWARLTKEAGVSHSRIVFQATETEAACTPRTIAATDRSSFESALKEECKDYFEDDADTYLRYGTIITEKKKLKECEHSKTSFFYEFDEKELNFFDQMSTVDTKDPKADLKYGAFLTVWNIPTDCEIMTETYRHGVSKYGCDAERWSPNNHYHKGQPVFVSQVFGFDNHNPIAIRFDCPDDKVERDFSKLQGRLLSTMTLREPVTLPRDWYIDEGAESDYVRYDKKRFANAKRVQYVLRGLDKELYPKACDLGKCDGLISSWFKKPSLNAEIEGHYPWDFECSDIFKLKDCDFALEARISVSGRRDHLEEMDPQLYICEGDASQVRIVWEEKLPQFGWQDYQMTDVILDEETKCSDTLTAKMISVSAKLTRKKIDVEEECPKSWDGPGNMTYIESGLPTSHDGKLRFPFVSKQPAKGIEIMTGSVCSIGKSEVTVVLRKIIEASEGPIHGLYGQYVSA